jgi:hypothetical protein
MKSAMLLLLPLAVTSVAFAQDGPKTNVVYQSVGSAGGGIVTAVAGKMFGAPVQGAPYSATITNESVQTLADGNRIVQSSTGTTARDSQGVRGKMPHCLRSATSQPRMLRIWSSSWIPSRRYRTR